MRICQTPEAIYHFAIKGATVASTVDLPFRLKLTEDQAIRLEDELHDALENVLKQFFPKSA